MKVICINAGVIETNGVIWEGSDLIEGKIYEALDEVIDDGVKCYLLEEFLNEIILPHQIGSIKGTRLKKRFRIIDTDWIDEAIEKAMNDEPELVNA